ncbi:MAG TPA: peptidylprolyl isomerase [Steroidobacteraceae bacterium]|nr:peptidylprolyl isomerase [Steroidobacteraceae bacterium]
MSSAAPLSQASNPSPARQRFVIPSWFREPLLHFAVLGGLLFGVDHYLSSRAGDPHTIVIGADVDKQAVDVFRDARGRVPDADELYALRRVWLDNEVLYREGIALGLDRGDNTIRDRVIFKSLSMIEAGLKAPQVDEAKLRAWFESHRAKYDEPARYDFEEAIVVGDRTESAVRAFVAALNAGVPTGMPGDVRADLRVFTNRPHENIVQSYGEEFAVALEAAPVGEWRVTPSKGGLRAVRLKAATAAKPASFDDLAGVVMQDWTDATMSEQRSAAVAALAKKYKVQVEAAK